MPNSLATRVADYFFVAGLADSQLITTFEYAKENNKTNESDYYQLQEKAIANMNNPKPKTNGRKRGYSLNDSALQAAASLLGVLDHVQHVIDHFDKERDIARDKVIAVQINPEKPVKMEDCRSQTEPGGIKRTSFIDISTTRKRAISSTDTSNRLSMSFSTPTKSQVTGEKKTVPNIFDLQYTPTVLMKYPKKNDATNEPFPAYAAMFCFPKDIKLYCGDAPPPPEQCHSFTITDENGSTTCGTCIVFYERLTDKLKPAVNNAIQQWVKSNMDKNSIEYAQHLKSKIETESQQLEQAKREQTQLFSVAREDTRRRSFEIEEIIRTCQENISLYKELLEPVKMGVSSADDIWVPKAIGLLGRMSWMNLYSDWLKILLDNIVGVGGRRNATPTIDIESTVINLIEEVPLPPPGRFEIGLTINRRPLFFSRPPMNQVPLLKDFSLYPIFRALSPHLILAVLETLLAEGKVVFISQYTGMLSLACETFRYLMFPLYWQFVFIPVLPERLLTCLQAPVPYMIGFKGTMDELEDHVPDDACVVNLDCNTMHQSERSMTIPDRQRRKLQAALEEYAPLHTKCRIPYGVPLSVQCAYPKGKMILNCSRSRTTDVFISPANYKPSRDSMSSDVTSVFSQSLSLASKTWSVTSSRSSIDSVSSMKETLPQYPGVAMLSTGVGNLASSSAPSLHSPPVSPIRQVTTIQSSTSSPKLKRVSVPTPIVPASNQPNHDLQDTKSNYRRSEPINFKTIDQDRNRLSGIKPKIHTGGENYSNLNTMATSPRISMSRYHHLDYQPQVTRRIRHIEGHIMAEIFTSELARFQGYRCVCGKQVTEEDEDRRPRIFMCCQECHLVTHNDCTDQILHPCLPFCFDENKVQDAFLRMFASLFYNYRSGIVKKDSKLGSSITANDQQMNNMIFSKEIFIKGSDKESRPFLSKLVNSQMFTQFITDRLLKSSQEPEILLFDEYIKLKLNRSKLKLVKEDTPFLNDDSYKVSQIIWSSPPAEPTTMNQNNSKRFPTNLQFKQV